MKSKPSRSLMPMALSVSTVLGACVLAGVRCICVSLVHVIERGCAQPLVTMALGVNTNLGAMQGLE